MEVFTPVTKSVFVAFRRPMELEFTPLHQDLTFLSPLAAERAAQLCRFMISNAEGTVVDIGCGWGALLLQLLESHPTLNGIGIDLNETRIAHGQKMGQEKGVADRLTLTAEDAREQLPDQVDGVICIGASQIWGPTDGTLGPIPYLKALQAIRAMLSPGQPAVYGEGIWTAEPTPEAVKPLSGRTDEFLFLPDLLDVARDAGFVVMGVHQATLEEWDRFESGFTAGYARWLAEHPAEHPSAAEVHGRLLAQQNAYYRGYRGILGMAYLELLAI